MNEQEKKHRLLPIKEKWISKENTLYIFLKVKVNGKEQWQKFRTFIFTDEQSKLINQDLNNWKKFVKICNFELYLSDKDFKNIENGITVIPHVKIDYHNQDFF